MNILYLNWLLSWKCFVLCFGQSSMKLLLFDYNVWLKIFCTLFCRKLGEVSFLWIKYMIQDVLYSVSQNARWKYSFLNQMYGWKCSDLCFAQSLMEIGYFELIVWFKIFCSCFCTKPDEDTFLWIKRVVQNDFALFCRKLDEDTLLWVKCMVLHMFILQKLHEDTFLWTKFGSKCFVLYFAQSSMKIRFFESNVWFKRYCTLFCRRLDEDMVIWTKCMVLHTSVLQKKT